MSFYPWQSIMTPVLSMAILGAPLAASDAGGGVVICIGLAALAVARWRESKEVDDRHAVLVEGSEAAAGEAVVAIPAEAAKLPAASADASASLAAASAASWGSVAEVEPPVEPAVGAAPASSSW